MEFADIQMGQTKPVKVFQLIAEDTIESQVLEIREYFRGASAYIFRKEEGCLGRYCF